MVFCVCVLSLRIMSLRFIKVGAGLVPRSFFIAEYLLLYGYTLFCLSDHQLMGSFFFHSYFFPCGVLLMVAYSIWGKKRVFF